MSPDSIAFDPSRDFVLTPLTQLGLLCLIIALNCLFFASWLVRFVRTLRGAIRQNTEVYVMLFLCCRADRLSKDDAKMAGTSKREEIIEKIEDIQFFIKKMRDIYAKDIFYEGHERFLELLQHIENERRSVDLTVKPHNLYIQGDVARERNLDPERIREAVNIETLHVDHEFGGLQLIDGSKGKTSERTSVLSRMRSRPASGRPLPTNISAKDHLGLQNQLRDESKFSPDLSQKSKIELQIAKKEDSYMLENVSDLTGSGSQLQLLPNQTNKSDMHALSKLDNKQIEQVNSH